MVTGTAVESVSTTDSGITVSAGAKGVRRPELMVATGRRPRTDRIGLESIGVDGGAELKPTTVTG